ncbi:MAG: hypothetical protein E4H00_07235 [Myxococcales bacterium]|nr:MAG: hypothetical protein E4H00_07235 [Myxococcales bacterium]
MVTTEVILLERVDGSVGPPAGALGGRLEKPLAMSGSRCQSRLCRNGKVRFCAGKGTGYGGDERDGNPDTPA